MSIGERIKLARRMKKFSQEELAQLAGVSKMAISKYERDQNTPSSGVLMQLSAALDVPIEFFFRPPIPEIQLQAYRKLTSLGKNEQEAVRCQVQEWLERYLELEDLFPEEKVGSITFPRYVVKTLADIEQAADSVRTEWALGLDAIENLMELLEDHHIKIGLIEGFDKFDACTFMAGAAPVIVTKAGLPGDRQRFNVAHELGHLVMKVGEGLDEEKAAQRFAGAFLVPAKAAFFELGQQRSRLDFNELYLLKRKYGMSMQAWIYRARDLGIVNTATADSLFRVFSQRGWKRQEPGAQLPPEEPQRFKRLVYRALAEDLISHSRGEELLKEGIDSAWMLHDPSTAIAHH